MFKGKYHPDYRNLSHKHLIKEIDKVRASRTKSKRQTTGLIKKLEEYITDNADLKFAFDDLLNYIAKQHGKEFERKEIILELAKKRKIFKSTYEELESHGYLEGQLTYV